eukprot:16454-Amphidinium_carterae.1
MNSPDTSARRLNEEVASERTHQLVSGCLSLGLSSAELQAFTLHLVIADAPISIPVPYRLLPWLAQANFAQ